MSGNDEIENDEVQDHLEQEALSGLNPEPDLAPLADAATGDEYGGGDGMIAAPTPTGFSDAEKAAIPAHGTLQDRPAEGDPAQPFFFADDEGMAYRWDTRNSVWRALRPARTTPRLGIPIPGDVMPADFVGAAGDMMDVIDAAPAIGDYGRPLFARVAANTPLGDWPVFVPTSPAGPSLTVPQPGRYLIEFGGYMRPWGGGAVFIAPAVSGFPLVTDEDSVGYNSGGIEAYVSVYGAVERTLTSPNTYIELYGRGSGNGGHAERRTLKVSRL